MSEGSFTAHVRHQARLAIIDLTGEINSFAKTQLNTAYSAAETSGPTAIALNFSGVTYINSTGIALIVSLLSRARKSHLRMVVFGLSDHFVEIFHITRLTDFMAIYPDEASVIASSPEGELPQAA
jgi:anti-anti-sigma factor